MVKKQYDCQSYRFLSFFKNLILKAMKKQRLLNKDNSILFFDSTDIKANPDANKNQDIQSRAFDVQKRANNELTSVLHGFTSSNFSFISRQLLRRP